MTAGQHAEVVVVGAGFAGLTCAFELHRRGVDVAVLEARDRIGGRTANTSVDGDTIELGGQFLGPGQTRGYELAAEFGAEVFATYDDGNNLLELDTGRPRRYRGVIPPVNPLALLDIGQAQYRLHRLARRVPADEPWRAPHAAELDRQTLDSWIRRTTRTGTARRLLSAVCTAVWAAHPEELSLLHALFYSRGAGGFESLIRTGGGAQQDRLDGGTHGLASRIAARLDGRVHLGTVVRGLAQDGHEVRPATGTGATWHARRVVLAVPPTLAARIDVDPPLPADRDALLQRLPMGSVIKCMAVYPRPFWRQDGLSGQALSLRGPVSVTLDSSPRDAGRGVLLGFIEGTSAREHARGSAERRRAAVLAGYVRLFGRQAAEPVHYVEQDWTSETFSRGGYAALFPPGAWTRLGAALRRPVGRIHWAGTETATHWYGFIEGAIRSADRVVHEITTGSDLAAR